MKHDDVRIIRKNRTQGVIAITLFAAAFVIGTYSIAIYNLLAAFLYFIGVLIGYLLNVYYFCRKCPHISDDSCRFVVFGKIACLFPKNRIGERYSYRDVIIIWIPRLYMFFFPRPWLFKHKTLFIVFWALIIIALLIWVFRVCRTCGNEKCPFRKMTKYEYNRESNLPQ